MLNKKENQPFKINCFHCKKLITIKYVRRSHDYSNKNNWEYWTETPENKNLYVCDDCLVKLYKQHKWEFRQLIPNKKKQRLLCQYILNGVINGRAEMVFITNLNNKASSSGESSKKKKKKKKKK